MAMPVAVEPAATDGDPRSASAIVGRWVTGRHVLHIESYSRTKAELPTGEFVESRPFRVGGRSWSMVYYPNGFKSEYSDFICIFLKLVDASTSSSSDPPLVKAKAIFSLLDQASNPVPTHTHTTGLHEFSVSSNYSTWGVPLIRRNFLEESKHLRDDCFRISCDVMTPNEFRTEDRIVMTPTTTLVAVPPPDLSRHLGDLLAAGHGTDVTFQVAGEMFAAHRYILAARSPVFSAQFLGAMRESSNVSSSQTACPIRMADMEPQVFRALLAFLYTDALPDYCSSGQEDEVAAMFQHLLVAADRYGLERLKLVCEDSLCKHMIQAPWRPSWRWPSSTTAMD